MLLYLLLVHVATKYISSVKSPMFILVLVLQVGTNVQNVLALPQELSGLSTEVHVTFCLWLSMACGNATVLILVLILQVGTRREELCFHKMNWTFN